MGKYLLWLHVALCTNPLVVQAADNSISFTSATKVGTVQESPEIREFEVRVDNKPRGSHSLKITSDKGKQEAEYQTDVKIDFVVYAYVFKFHGTEVWRDGRIESADIRSDDAGKKKTFALKSEAGTQQVTFNGKLFPVASAGIMTTAYWQLPPAELRSKSLSVLDVDSGTTRNATLTLIGPATVSCTGRSIACQHFKIDGPSPAELWFDDQSRLVRQTSMEQGHLVELRLKQIRASNNEK